MAKKYAGLDALRTFLDNLKNTFAALNHTHKISDLTDYTVDETLSSTSTNPVQNKVLDAEFEAISVAMGTLETAIDGKLDKEHNHDDVYYTETEIDEKLEDKADFSHTHTVSDISDLTATATELNYVEGITSNVQTQLDTLTSNKVSKTGDIMTGDLTIKANFGSVRFNDADGNKMSVLQANNDSHTTSIYAYPTDKSTYYEKYDFPTPSTGVTANKVYKVLTTKDVTATVAEINCVDGVTGNIQTQLNNRAYKADPSFTGSISMDRLSSGTVGNSSVAVGYKNTASGSFSFAEGCSTTASGYASHAGGNGTTASGSESFAIGSNSTAQGDSSVVMGDGNTAVAECSFVHGSYSVTDTNGDYAHIVGIGMANKRANGYTLDWDGNGWFKGDVYVGGTSMNDTLASRVTTEADHEWTLIYDSGEISDIANSISGINVSGYTNFQIVVRCYNDGDSYSSRAGSAIFVAQNGKSYQFPVWTDMFSKSISTVSAMANFKIVDRWLVCPCASRIIGDYDVFDTTEGGSAVNLAPTGSGMMKCTSPLSTLTISNLDQNSNYYFGTGSRVIVWGRKV